MAPDSLRDHNYSHLDLETLRYHLENITSMCSTCAVYGDSILTNVTALSPSPCCAYSPVSKTVIYRKQQKFRGTKLSRFTGFYQNVGKTFAFLLQLYNTCVCSRISAPQLCLSGSRTRI